MHTCAFLMLSALVLVQQRPATTATATTANAAAANAADLYRDAIEAVPRAETDAERGVLLDVMTAPLDDAARALVERGAASLALLERASDVARCDWGFDPETPRDAARMVSRADNLAELAVLRARLRADARDHAGALADARRLLLLSRRLASSPSAVRQLQETVVWYKGVNVVGLMALNVPIDALRAFLAGVDQLPPAASPADVVAVERRSYVWVHRKLLERPDARELLQGMMGLTNDMVGTDLQPTKLDDLLDDHAKREAVFAEVERVFDDMAAVLRLPADQREAEWQALARRVRDQHPLVVGAWRVGEASRRWAASQAIKLELLHKAIAIRASQEGEWDHAAAAKLAPPFEYVAQDNGFELKDWSQDPKVPAVLTVGRLDAEHTTGSP
jgi:hypothetical protein